MEATFTLDDGCGTVTVNLGSIERIETQSNYVSLRLRGAGYVHVIVDSQELASLYRLMADRLEAEAEEADAVVGYIK